MKNRLFLTLAAATLVVAGCENEDFVQKSGTSKTITASLPGGEASTRTALDGNKVIWSRGDAFTVFSKEGADSYNDKAELTSGAGTQSGTFNLIMSCENPTKVAALYPYTPAATFDEETKTISGFSLADTYTYEENSIKGAPMATLIEGDGTIAFKNAGSVLAVTVKNIPAGVNKAVLTATDKNIAGASSITFTDGIPTLAVSDGSSNNTVTVNFTATTGEEKSDKTFHFPLPAANYASLTFTMYEGSTSKLSRTYASKNVVRNKRYPAELRFDAASGAAPTTATPSNATSTLETASVNNVEVDMSSATSAEIKLPQAAVGQNNEKSTTISFTEATTGTIKIAAAEADKQTSEKVTIAAKPAATAEAYEESNIFEIDLPKSTVTLAATEGAEVLFKEVTASTADNTLVIEQGVTVTTLKIKKGNVRVSGKIKNISRTGDNEDAVTTIIKEPGSEIPSDISDPNIVVIDEEEMALRDAMKENGSYTLKSDFVLSSPLVVDANVTLDLNGHSLTANEKGLQMVLYTDDAVVLVRRGASLTINDATGKGTIDSKNVMCAVKVTDWNDENGTASNKRTGVATLVVNGGNLIGYNYGISGNGNRHNTSITINGGSVKATCVDDDALAIYHPQAGTLKITGGEFTAKSSAVELRSGNMEITGGNFLSTSKTFEAKKNGNGPTATGAAVAVSQHSTDKDIKAVIKGGTFTGVKAFFEKDMQNSTGSKSVKIEGGTFCGEVYSENSTEMVSGGTFSDPSAFSYLANNASVTLAEGNYEWAKPIEVKKSNVIIDLNNSQLYVSGNLEIKDKKGAIGVHQNASLTLKNGIVGSGDTEKWMRHGVYAHGKSEVNLVNVVFTENVTYAYNGAYTDSGDKAVTGDKLTAEGCVFQGWMSAWYAGAKFSNCTFTIGKRYYPGAICYGNTVFEGCRFFQIGKDADEYDKSNACDPDGYYRCDYVVAACEPATTIDMNGCVFIDEKGAVKGPVTVGVHPYHACKWGDGTVASANVKVDGTAVVGKCSGSN